ncbi:MAG: pilus assembly protein TadG-related protein [Propionibacteriales bacterium]|jgi:Flp pilus assembly protein TadG|nr:pilus assembly protein TadG-related protein [Propionibacteriales bacterium]
MGRGERGSVTVWMVLIVMVLSMVMGIAVDLSGQVNAKRRASDVAAQAARVAGQQISPDAYLADGRSVELAVAKAKTAAVDYIEAAGMTGSARVESGTELVVQTETIYRPIFLSAAGIGDLKVTGSASIRVVRVADDGEER